jgi:hypothetical protein
MITKVETKPTITDFADIKAHIRQRCGKPELEITYTDEELNELLKRLDDDLEKVEVIAEPIIVKSEPIIIDPLTAPFKPKLTNKDLINSLDKIHKEVANGEYSKISRQRLKKINIELTKRDISPVIRNASKFDFIACKNPLCSLYMNDLKTFELQWLYVQYKGHEVDNETMHKLYKDIFTKPQFDWGQAMQIAIGSYVDKKGVTKYLTTELKLRHLMLSDSMQSELTIFRSEKNRKRHIVAIAKDKIKEEEARKFKIEKMNIKDQLEKFLKSYSPDNKDIPSVSECLSIWEAVKIVGSSKKHTAISHEYKNLSGIKIGVSKTRRRIILLKKELIL